MDCPQRQKIKRMIISISRPRKGKKALLIDFPWSDDTFIEKFWKGKE